MLHPKRWQTVPALMTTIAIATSAIAPVTLATSAIAAPEPLALAQLFPSSQYPNSQYPNSQYPSSRYPNSQYPNSQYPNSQYPNSQYPNSQYPNSQYPNSRYPNSQYPNSRYPNSQYPNSQYPSSQYPNSQYPNSSYGSVALPAGTQIPARYDAAEKIIVAPNETVPLTLTVSRNLRSSGSREILIPAGSQISGRVQPVQDGSQFVADTLVLPDGARLPIRARSQVITQRQEVQSGVNGDALIKGSAIGAGAATIFSGVLGNRRITIPKILLGAGAGAAGGLIFGRKKNEVIAIDSNSDLFLTLDSRLALNRNYGTGY